MKKIVGEMIKEVLEEGAFKELVGAAGRGGGGQGGRSSSCGRV